MLKTYIFLFALINCLFSCNKHNEQKNLNPYGYGYKNPNTIATAKGEISNFALLDHQGVFQELYRQVDSNAVVIISQSNNCPLNQKLSQTIN